MINKWLVIIGVLNSAISMNINNNFNFDKMIFEFANELTFYLDNNKNAKLNNYFNIKFGDSNGYFFEYKNNNENLQSILVKGDINSYQVEAIYEPNYRPFEEGNYYSLSPLYFINENEVIINNVRKSKYSFDKLGVTYDHNLIDADRYLVIDDLEEKIFDNSTLNISAYELKDAPFYMNTLFNGYGCVPTAAAMYLAYLSNNGYEDLVGGQVFPLKHTDDEELVENLIYHLGVNYFKTENDGTKRNNIPSGYINYFKDHRYDGFTCDISKNYLDLMRSIDTCGLPVQTSISYDITKADDTGHPLLTYGYKRYLIGGKYDDYIIASEGAEDTMSTIILSTTKIREFYFIYK